MYGDQIAQNPGGGSTESLNSGRYPAIPTSAAHLAERMESGGARVEETLSRLNCKYQTLFFTAGMAVLAGAILGLVSSAISFHLANLVDCAFLALFGLIMMLLDVPGSPRWAGRYRSLLRKYMRFLTRLTGKALWFLFLGCMTACTRAISVVTAVSLSFFIILVSLMGLLIAIRKSLRLEKVRKAVLMSCKGAFIDVYRKYSMTDPLHGMQFEEFNRMCADHTCGKLQFDVTDLGIIYNALDDHQKSAINEREFTEWMTGSMTYL